MNICKCYKKDLKEHLKCTGSLQSISERRTGKTTGVALAAIGILLQNPESVAANRAPGLIVKTRVNTEVLYIMRNIINLLELDYFEWEEGCTWIKYNPYLSQDDLHKALAE